MKDIDTIACLAKHQIAVLTQQTTHLATFMIMVEMEPSPRFGVANGTTSVLSNQQRLILFDGHLVLLQIRRELLDRLILDYKKKNGRWPPNITINRAEARAILKEIEDPDFMAEHGELINQWLDGKAQPFYSRATDGTGWGVEWSPDIPIIVKQ